MTAANFPMPVLGFLAQHEGGWSDNAADPGGPTMAGVTQRTYDGWRKRKGLPTRSVRELTGDEHKAIYREYWDAIRGDDIPSGLDNAVFDPAVNSGPGQAAKWLQRAVGLSGADVDGAVGPVTLAAVGVTDTVETISRMCAQRMSFLRQLRTWATFKNGWTRRVAEVEATSIRMASIDALRPKAVEAEKRAETAKSAGAATGTAGTASAGAGGADASGTADVTALPAEVLIALGAVLLIVALAFAWRAYKQRTRKRALEAEETRVETPPPAPAQPVPSTLGLPAPATRRQVMATNDKARWGWLCPLCMNAHPPDEKTCPTAPEPAAPERPTKPAAQEPKPAG